MTQIKKKTLISVFLVLFALMTTLFCITYNRTYAKSADSVISEKESVTVTVAAQGPECDGRTGIKVTTNSGLGSIAFSEVKGPFDLTYRAFSNIDSSVENQKDVLDIKYLTFDFVSKVDSAESFKVRIEDIKNPYSSATNPTYGTKYLVWHKGIRNEAVLFKPNTNYNETHPGNLSHLLAYDGPTFRNHGADRGFGEMSKITFNPFDMRLTYTRGSLEVLLVDFDDPSSMEQNFGSYQTVEDMSTFDVVMTIEATAGKNASVMLYDLNGENLGGETIEDVAGPIVDTRINNPKGVDGVEYNLDLANYKMFDVIDGYTAFNGDVTITTPLGVTIPVENGKFTPEGKGRYTVNFIPKDSSGNVGKTGSISVDVVSKDVDEFEWGFDYEITNDLVLNNSVKLPGASFYSPLAGQYDGEITPSAKILANNKVIQTIEDASEPFTVSLKGQTSVKVVYYATDYIGRVCDTSSDAVVINNNNVSIDVSKMPTVCVVGEHIFVEAASYNGKALEHTVISPRGNIYCSEKVLIDEVGFWTVNYSYEGKVYTQYVEGVETITSLWNTKLGLVVKDKVGETASYARTKKIGSILNSSTPYSYAEFKNVINVSDYTPDDILLEWFTVPKVMGTNEFKQINVILQDLEDASRSVRLEHYLTPYYYYENMATRVYVGDILVEEYCYIGHCTFYGEWTKQGDSQYNNSPLKISFDYANGILYLGNDYESRGVSLVNPDTIGVGNEWKGFTNNELKLTIEFAAITGEANLMVRTVDNLSLTKEIVTDTVAPKVTVNYDPTNIPKAVIGETFPVMSAFGVDSVDGRLSDVKVAVKQIKDGRVYDYPLNADNTFIPNEVGTYKISYSVSDLSGNVGTKDIFIQAVKESEPLDIDIRGQLADLYPAQINLGEKIIIYPAKGIGGSGFVNVEIEVKDGNEKLTVDDVYVTPKKATNNLTVVYKLTDYLGQTNEVSVTIKVVRSSSAIFSDFILPPAVMAGKAFKIPQVTAKIYNENNVGTDAPVTVKINGKDYTGETYTPDKVGSFTLQYTTANGSTEVYTINVVAPEKDEYGYLPGYLNAYFYTVDGDLSINTNPPSAEEDKWMLFNVKEDSQMFFVNPQSARRLTVEFAVRHNYNRDADGNLILDSNNQGTIDPSQTTNYIGKINFTYVNVDNPSEKIVLSVQKDPDPRKTTGLVTINGRETYTLLGDMTTYLAQGISIGYEGNKVIGQDGAVIATLTETFDGAKFEGFTSEKVYLFISFEDVQQASEFRIVTFNSMQSFYPTFVPDSTFGDCYPPELVTDREFASATYGVEYVFPNMSIEDVLDSDVTASMKITSPSGKTIYDGAVKSGYKFIPMEYGMYWVEISTKDSTGASIEIVQNITVLNVENVKISLRGSVPTVVNKNDAVSIPSLENVPSKAKVFIYVLTPGGVRIVPTGNKMTFKATEYGNYKLFYCIVSESGVVNTQSFTIKCK